MFVLKFVALLALCASSKAAVRSRIIGGSDAYDGQFPYQVSVRDQGDVHFCGGVILNTRWVITAGHCVAGRLPNNVQMVAGSYVLNTGGLRLGTAQIVMHPEYNGNTVANDISLLQTQFPILMNAFIQPIQLGTDFIAAGYSATMTGWGLTAFPGPLASTLQWLTKETITNAECRALHTTINANRVFDNTLCTFAGAGEGFCLGDHGGALVVGNSLVGIISWNVPCGAGYPDIHARMSSHRPWILTVI